LGHNSHNYICRDLSEVLKSRVGHKKQVFRKVPENIYGRVSELNYSDDTRNLILQMANRNGFAGYCLGVAAERSAGRIDPQKNEDALRESEELYRIILLSMSDAVFLTDDAGELIFICPNADVIFGYSQKEIREMGYIRDILGAIEFDADCLIEYGEISNIEHTIIDKCGNEHELLVNIKKVDIQGGTRLYSCRDITERKRAERELQRIQTSLITEQVALRKKNVALKELLNQIENEKNQVRHRIKENIESIIIPLIDSIQDRFDFSDCKYLDILKESLTDICSPFIKNIEGGCKNLTPREIEICNMIKRGCGSKDIARVFGVSPHTVIKQRKKIRKKLGIARSNTNLASYLKNL